MKFKATVVILVLLCTVAILPHKIDIVIMEPVEKIDLPPLYGDFKCDCRIHHRGDSSIYVDRSGYIKLIRFSDGRRKFK